MIEGMSEPRFAVGDMVSLRADQSRQGMVMAVLSPPGVDRAIASSIRRASSATTTRRNSSQPAAKPRSSRPRPRSWRVSPAT